MRYTAAALCALLLASLPLSHADEKVDRLAGVVARLDALEKVVVNDPLNPDRTVLSRLKSLEQKTRDLAEADAAQAKVGAAQAREGAAQARAGGRLDDAVQKSLAETQRTLEQLDRRLRAAEEAKAAGRDGAELKDLSRQVKQVESAIDALKDRVSKMERGK